MSSFTTKSGPIQLIEDANAKASLGGKEGRPWKKSKTPLQNNSFSYSRRAEGTLSPSRQKKVSCHFLSPCYGTRKWPLWYKEGTTLWPAWPDIQVLGCKAKWKPSFHCGPARRRNWASNTCWKWQSGSRRPVKTTLSSPCPEYIYIGTSGFAAFLQSVMG